MAVCINKNSLMYQTLKQRSGLSEFILESVSRDFLEKYGRLPYLDELPGSDSSGYIKDRMKVRKDGSAKIDNILEFAGTQTVGDAVVSINNTYRDVETTIIPINNDALVNIEKRPSMDADIQERVVPDENVNSYIVFNNTLEKLANLYGITFNTVTDAELSSEKWRHLMPEQRLVNAFIYDGQIYINMDRASVDAPLHEMLHLFVGSMRFTNPNLYQQLIQSAEQFPNYAKLASQFSGKTRNDINEEIFITEVSKHLTGQKSDLVGVDDKLMYEISYNIHRVLDSVLMGTESSKTITDDRLYSLSLKDIAFELNSAIMTNNMPPLRDSELHRTLNNMKSELMREGKLEEICD